MIKWISIAVLISLTGCTVQEEKSEMSTAETTVLALYDAFGKREIPKAMELMADDIMWNVAEGFPYADGNPYVGGEAIINGVFARIGADWSRWKLHKERVFATDTMVVVEGYYDVTLRATGEENTIQVAHIWTVEGGKVTELQQYTDTLKTAVILAKGTSAAE